MNYVTVKKFAEMTGYTCKAVYTKIERGIWKEGLQWRRAPDGRVLIFLTGIENWIGGDD